MKKIAIGIDGVIADSEPWLVKQLEEASGKKFIASKPRTFDFIDGIDISLKDLLYNLDIALIRHNDKIPVLDRKRTYLALALLQHSGTEIHFISARADYLFKTTNNWLQKHFGGLAYTLHLVGNIKNPAEQKEKWLQELKINAIVEDRLKTVNQLKNKNITKYLVNREWNAGRYAKKEIFRVLDLYDAVQHYLLHN